MNRRLKKETAEDVKKKLLKIIKTIRLEIDVDAQIDKMQRIKK